MQQLLWNFIVNNFVDFIKQIAPEKQNQAIL